MATRLPRLTLVVLAACAVIDGPSAAAQQESAGLPIPATPASSSRSVMFAQRPASALPPEYVGAQPDPAGVGLPPIDVAPTDDRRALSARGQAPQRPDSPESGRLAPIAMEGVRAPIAAADIGVASIGTQVLPDDQAAKVAAALVPLPNGQDHMISGITYRWQAANTCQLPLYFEEPMLERNGVQRCPSYIQPAVSGAKFLGNIVMVPYRATLWPAVENRYTLGHFRPGSSAPALRDWLPWSTKAALVQVGGATGAVVGLPW